VVINTETATQKILIVDDDESFRLLLELHLQNAGYKTILAGSGREALKILAKDDIDLIISDYVMPEKNGIELLSNVKSKYKDIPFIIITAYGSIEDAVSVIKNGAYDYITKPFNSDDLLSTVNRALNHYRLNKENKSLKEHLRGLYSFHNIITSSPFMIKALKLAGKVIQSRNTTISIYGESGTGKEVLARAVHYAGETMGKNFVAVNCAAIPPQLLETELFGHVRGAFTGADRNREGKFDLAQGGTILLDEIGDMPLELQAKMLRVLENRTYEKVGSNKSINADFRVIVSTHRNLEALVKQGLFREDLYHRINVFPITLPPLRERKEDIELLAEHFVKKFNSELGKNISGISKEAMQMLLDYSWPGNVRELKNCIERAAILTDSEFISPEYLNICREACKGEFKEDAATIRIEMSMPADEFSLDAAVDRIVQFAMQRCGNNKAKAVKFLKVGRNFLYRRK
jgi:DNA-binding NtrC family response regulator